jgi:hypothetical protein
MMEYVFFWNGCRHSTFQPFSFIFFLAYVLMLSAVFFDNPSRSAASFGVATKHSPSSFVNLYLALLSIVI